MSITISKRLSWGGSVMFASETATTIKEAIAEMRSALKDREKLNLQYAYLQGADLRDADLQDADLRDANLRDANLRDADLRGADLQGANLQDAYLRGADLQGADLQGADLRGADLQGADLQGADLRGADLRGADLRGADLRGAYLRGAYLRGADLQGANLQGADLRGADLRGAYLRGADLRDASVGGGALGISLTPKTLGLPDADPSFALLVIEAATGSPNALEMVTWHTCETTHCLAGWAVNLSGLAGKALEVTTSPSVAGAILAPSLAHLFYASNEEARRALPKIKAELEAQVAGVKAEMGGDVA